MRLRADRIEWREVDGEVVGLHLGDVSYFAVNRTGAVLWPRLLEGATREQLAECIRHEFGRDETAALGDVDAFLGELRERDLIED